VDPVSEALIGSFPFEQWRATRRRNLASLVEALAGHETYTVLTPAHPDDAPFSVPLVLESRERHDLVRQRLLAARIYPAVLWQLEESHLSVSDESRSLSRRLLSIPCDARYNVSDMQHVAEVLTSAAD
jgi:dTDP-4-amino-4,6-dideoxygalactose transaminase